MIEITLVGMYAETSPACVSMIGSAVSEPPPSLSESFAARSSKTRVQIEHVARIRFAARRTAEQQRELAIGLRLLGQDRRKRSSACLPLSRKHSPIVTPV